MSRKIPRIAEARREPRIALPAMYTQIRVKESGKARFKWSGHIYDISRSGMRLELDQPLEPGTAVQIQASLPGADHVSVRLKGHIVRLHDDGPEAGPVRMGLAIDRFDQTADRRKLDAYLANRIPPQRQAA